VARPLGFAAARECAPEPRGRSRVGAAVTARGRAGAWLAAVAALALLPRLLFLAETWGRPGYLPLVPGSDTHRFHVTAERIAAGEWALAGEPFAQGPVYPYALALLYRAFGSHAQGVRVVQALLGAAASALVFALARRWLPLPFAFSAAALYALYGYAVFAESLLLDPSLLACLYLGIALGLVRHAEGGGARWLAAAGLALGGAIGTRPNAALLAPAVALAAWLGARPPARSWLALALGVALPLLPFVARNLATGQPALHLSSQGRKVLVASNLPDARGAGWAISPEADALLDGEAGGAGDTLAQLARAARREPGAFALLQLRKLHALFASYEIPNVANYHLWRESSRVLAALPVGVHLIAALGLPGSWLLARRREAWPALLVAAGIAASVLPFYVIARFRMPLVPFLCLGAGALLAAGWDAWRRRASRRIASLAAAVALAAVATTSPVRDRIEPGSLRGLGAHFEAAGELDAAAAHYRRALAKRAGYARAAEDLVCLELARGRRAEAAAAARLHLAARPGNEHVQRLLAVAEGGALPPGDSFACRRAWDVDPRYRAAEPRSSGPRSSQMR